MKLLSTKAPVSAPKPTSAAAAPPRPTLEPAASPAPRPQASRFDDASTQAPRSVAGPSAPPTQVVKASATQVGRVFDGWLKVHAMSVSVSRGGMSEAVPLFLLQRPGHDSTHVQTLQLNGRGPPTLVYKAGDTRPSALLRGTPYVATGIVAGSLDHAGVDAEATAVMEIGEELGRAPRGKLVRLGDAMPTMPVTDGPNDIASTESDNYYLAVLSKRQAEVTGDGGGLEVVGLMKPEELSVAQAIARIDSGGIRENARARVALSRGLDKAGFLPQLGAWVSELPPALRDRAQTLGLGEAVDPRAMPDTAPPPAHAGSTKAAPKAPAPDALAAQVSDADLGAPRAIEVTRGAQLFDGPVRHLARNAAGQSVPVGKPTPVQTLHVDDDRLKLVQYVIDPERGPLVRMDLVERPALVAKGALTGHPEALQRLDVTDLRVPLPKVSLKDGKVEGAEAVAREAPGLALQVAQAALPGAQLQALGAPSFASPGQSDLRYHLLAAKLPAPAGGQFLTLAEALIRCRSQGAGDANTEAALLRLADALGWIPQLGMSVAQAQALAAP